MINQLNDALGFHKEVLNLRQERQKVLAGNIANADTPNFKARDFDFAGELSRAVKSSRPDHAGGQLTTTSARHIAVAGNAHPSLHNLQYRIAAQPSMDGNTVEMETERVRFADNAVRHQASLTFLNGYIRSMKTAMQSE